MSKKEIKVLFVVAIVVISVIFGLNPVRAAWKEAENEVWHTERKTHLEATLEPEEAAKVYAVLKEKVEGG